MMQAFAIIVLVTVMVVIFLVICSLIGCDPFISMIIGIFVGMFLFIIFVNNAIKKQQQIKVEEKPKVVLQEHSHEIPYESSESSVRISYQFKITEWKEEEETKEH